MIRLPSTGVISGDRSIFTPACCPLALDRRVFTAEMSWGADCTVLSLVPGPEAVPGLGELVHSKACVQSLLQHQAASCCCVEVLAFK